MIVLVLMLLADLVLIYALLDQIDNGELIKGFIVSVMLLAYLLGTTITLLEVLN
jgi:hypothetical protein